MKEYLIPNIIMKEPFKDHKKYKSELLNLIKKQNDKDWENKDDYYNDKILKTDWMSASDWERPWIKLVIESLYKQLNDFAKHMGFESVKLHKMWYQQYGFGDLHNWHTHDGNYTGTYYLEFDENCSTTEFLYPNDLQNSFTIKVKEGDLLFFPCHLIHRSAASKSENIKSIISWNVDFGLIQKKNLHDRERIKILQDEPNQKKK